MSGVVIGITGGIASGKSTVAGMFAALGAVVLDADRLAHQALETAELTEAVKARWGAAVLTPEGTVDRKALGQVVFGDPDELRALEQLIHPRVRQLIDTALTEHAAAGQSVLLDVPLLLESEHYAALCHCVVYVHCDRAVREARAAERGWQPGELARREAQQFSPETKAQRATYKIHNDKDLEATRARVQQIWQQVLEEQRV